MTKTGTAPALAQGLRVILTREFGRAIKLDRVLPGEQFCILEHSDGTRGVVSVASVILSGGEPMSTPEQKARAILGQAVADHVLNVQRVERNRRRLALAIAAVVVILVLTGCASFRETARHWPMCGRCEARCE